MAKVTKTRKREWHDKMRQRACDYSHGVCDSCEKITDVSHGVIHHLAYPSRVYEMDVETLIDRNICVWLCKECHEKVHFTDRIEGSSTGKLNAGKCHLCGKICYGGWERAKTLGVSQCICRKCHQANKKREEIIKQGQKELF
jgi:hypothetical protein